MYKLTQNELYQYRKTIQYKFSQIFFTKNDQSISHQDQSQPSSINSITQLRSLYITQELRQQIFQKEYPMEKKGKKFGSSQMRIFKCVRQTQDLLQVDKNRNAKRLPIPVGFNIQVKSSSKDSTEMQWNSKLEEFNFRIKLTFKERSEVCVYFEKEQSCMEIACFIKSLINKNHNQSVFSKCQGLLENSLVSCFTERIVKYRNEVGRRKQIKKKKKAIKSLQIGYSDGLFIKKMIQGWRNRIFSKVRSQKQNKYIIKEIKLIRVDVSNDFQSKELRLTISADTNAEQAQIEKKQTKRKNIIQEITLIEVPNNKKNQSEIEKVPDYVEYYPKQSSVTSTYKELGAIGSKQTIKLELTVDKESSNQNLQVKESQQSYQYLQKIHNFKYQSSFSIFQLQYFSHFRVSTIEREIQFIKSNRILKKRKIQLNLLPLGYNKFHRSSSVQKKKSSSQKHNAQQQCHQNSFEQRIRQENTPQPNVNPLSRPQLSIIAQIEVLYSQFVLNSVNISEDSKIVQKIDNQLKKIQPKDYKDEININDIFLNRNYLFGHQYMPFLENLSLKPIILNPNSQIQSSQQQIQLLPVVNQRNQAKIPSKSIQDYCKQYFEYTMSCYPVQISFNCVHKLSDALNIDQIRNKFMLSETFSSLKDKKFIGTLIYQLLVEKSQYLKYYDVEKLILEHNALQMRRIMNAIKTFDQNPRINFTSPLFKMVRRILYLIKNQANSTFLRICSSENNDFDVKELIGIESQAFFIVLAIIKQFSSVFIYQKDTCKRVLHLNTLLLKIVLRKQFSLIYNKFLSLQLNIEAFFGIEFFSLLSEYFSDEIWSELITRQINEKKRDDQVFNLIIASFIVLLQETMRDKEQILSGESLIVYLKQKSMTIDTSNDFLRSVSKVSHLVKFHKEGQYKSIMKELGEIYERSNLNEGRMSFGSLAEAVYKQFLQEKPKSMPGRYMYMKGSDLNNSQPQRKIFLSIDKINLCESINVRKVLIQLFQAKNALYSHEFKNIDIQTFSLTIELTPKTTENIVIYIKTKQKTYYYTLDLNHTSSNYYHHLTRPLSTSLKHNSIQDDNSYISFQLFIKDLTPIEHFENIIPQKYFQSLLYEPSISDLLTDANKYLRNFRMKQNNFNLLYSKFGWYGNHYLLPKDRLLSLFFNYDPSQNPKIDPKKQHNNVYALIHYTRTIFGKAILPKPKSLSAFNLLIDIVKNGIRSSSNINSKNQSVSNNKSLTPDEHKTTQNLLTYTLQNFDIDSITSFFQFYTQMSQLPLMDYLTYDPMLFYILPPIEFSCTYTNKVEGVKLKIVINLCDSPDERKEGQQWEKLVTEFFLQEINLIDKIMVQLQQFYFGDDDLNENDGSKLMQHSSSSRVNRRQISTLNIKAKQFYSVFPKTLNFSQMNFNVSIDQFGLILKFNILLSMVKKLYKGCFKKSFSLKEEMSLKREQMKRISSKFHYDLKLSQDNHQLPNIQYFHLFRYMIEARKQLRVEIQLRKQRNVLSQQNLTSGNFLYTGNQKGNSGQNDITHQQLMDRAKHVQFNKLKTYEHWGIINGNWKKIEVIEKLHSLKNDHLENSSAEVMGKCTFKREAAEDTIIQVEPLIQDTQTYVVEEMETKKLYKLSNDTIIWRTEDKKRISVKSE